MALSITKAYSAGNPLLESHLDNFRSGLQTFFTGGITSASFDAGMTLTAAKFTGGQVTTNDNVTIDFGTGSAASIGLDASKNFVFNTAASTTEIQFYAGSTYYMEFWTDKVYLPGDIILADEGGSNTVLQALSSYKKPVLEWAGAADISLSCNSSSSTTTIIYFPTFVCAVDETANTSSKYRQASINVTANGYGTSDTGTAKGGRRSGVSLTSNSWYAVYACKVRSGTNYSATAGKYVIVFDDTLPTAANDATLDSYYGNGCWVYLGLIRYGFGAAGNTAAIPKFKYCRNGWCYFYENDGGAGGVNLAYAATDADDSSSAFYTLLYGMTGQKVPATVGAVALSISRQYVSDWYLKDISGDIIWAGGWQTDDSTLPHGFLLEIPFTYSVNDGTTEYKFYQTRKGNGAVAKVIALQGFCDTFMALRRQGPGI